MSWWVWGSINKPLDEVRRPPGEQVPSLRSAPWRGKAGGITVESVRVGIIEVGALKSSEMPLFRAFQDFLFLVVSI